MTIIEPIEEEDHGTNDAKAKELAPGCEDLWQLANDLLKKELSGKKFINNSDCKVIFNDNHDMHAYGDIVGHKPSKNVTFEVRLVLHYIGRCYLGDTCTGQLIGYINVPKMTQDDIDEDWEYQVKPFECGPQTDIPRELCEAEQRIISAMEAGGEFRSMVRAVMRRVARHYQPADHDAGSSAGSGGGEGEKETAAVSGLTAELREQCKPEKYKRFKADVAAGKAEEMAEVDLNFCALNDEDFKPVLDDISQCVNVTTIDLQYNELTDVSLQMLIAPMAAGAMPKLKELRLGNNKFGDVGATILKGLSMLRKQIVVKT